MRISVSAALLGLSLAAATPALAQDLSIPDRRLTVEQIEAFLMQARPVKPGARTTGNDTCRWANDLECDDPDIGTGACAMGTDYSDCRYLREGETDTCRWARDGECDEPGLGTGVCTQGTDRTDCAGIVHLRFQTDSCETAFNGVCEDRDSPHRDGPARCEARTDRADCLGRERPMTISDHFQGYDDREFLDTAISPWASVGVIDLEDAGTCTATLIARDILVTAAHCVHDDDGRVSARGTFRTGFGRRGGALEAHVVRVLAAPKFDSYVFESSNKLDGADWAYLKIDRPLGDEVGFLEIEVLESLEGIVFSQAGYSYDTGDHLSGHLGCEAVALNPDNTLEHRCDTTQGDSGSPIMVLRDGAYHVIGVDSNYRSHEDGPPTNIAVRARDFLPALVDFAADRTGSPVSP